MQIYQQLLALIESGQPCALATLVSTSGSSPQNTGAKVIFLPDGRMIGTIGGGCMEVEARRIALDCLRTRECRLFELLLDDDFGWDDGLICGGRVQIFIDPQPDRSLSVWQAISCLQEHRETAAVCTIVQSEDTSEGLSVLARPLQDLGLEVISHEDNDPWTTDRIIPLSEAVSETIACGNARTVVLDANRSVYIEPILPRPTVLIAGAGHVGAAVGQIAGLCGFEVVIVDDRPAFANKERLPFADKIAIEKIPKYVRDYPIDDQTFVVIVTRGHRNDASVLRECIHSNAKYIGMIGSKRKIVVIFEELLREGLATKEELRRVRTPMGLTIGDVDVGEIAVSIMAEVIAVRRGANLADIRPMQYTPPFLRDSD